jgi:hypothetical protein
VDADRGVLREPGPRGVLGVLGEGRGPAQVPHRHAKSKGIDADMLAGIPLADPRELQQLELPGPDAAALDRRARACDRLTRAASGHRVQIKDLAGSACR